VRHRPYRSRGWLCNRGLRLSNVRESWRHFVLRPLAFQNSMRGRAALRWRSGCGLPGCKGRHRGIGVRQERLILLELIDEGGVISRAVSEGGGDSARDADRNADAMVRREGPFRAKDFFFHDLQLREPDYQLGIDTSSYGREVADVIAKSDDLFAKIKPDALLILGDTFSGLSVMPAAHRGIKVFHMEAGLRAWDKRMPEQRNRILIDHMSDILLPFNRYHRENLLRENIHPSKIFATGNPTFEVIRAFLPQIKDSNIVQRLGLAPREYFLVTAHRSENVDQPQYLAAIIQALGRLHQRFAREVIYPMHPRTKSKLGSLPVPPGVPPTTPETDHAIVRASSPAHAGPCHQ